MSRSRPYNRYRHVTNAMKDMAADGIVLANHTRCPKCQKWIPNDEIVDGVFPVHYLIGKIPCGWNDQDTNMSSDRIEDTSPKNHM